MSNQLPKNLQQQPVLRHQEIIISPLPDPEIMARYKNADPSFPERIMKMAENHNAADVRMKNRVSLGNMIIPMIGQIFTLILGAGSILACIYLAMAGYTNAAIATIIGGFSPMIIASFKNFRQKK